MASGSPSSSGSSGSSLNVERLWACADGTICLLIERETAPRFEICVVRGEEVLRQDRLYANASARMLAETWRGGVTRSPLQHHA